MKITERVIFLIIVCSLVNNLCAQGFLNLGFESANVSGFSPGDNNVPTNAAIPGWTAHYFQPGQGIQPASEVWYDTVSLGGAVISINDTNTGSGFVPLQGKFSVFLFGGLSQRSATISQTGLVPGTANSIQMEVGHFGGIGAFTVSLNGQDINMTPLGTFPTYTLYRGDIASFANQTAALDITALPVQSGPGPNPVLLDNIIFSPQSIPEPHGTTLLAIGALLLGFRRWQNSEQ